MVPIQPFKIIIVGGGIGGLATAIALRAPNRHIVVLERAAEIKEIGAAISLQPNASKIITKWGLDPFFEKRGVMIDKGFKIYSLDGKVQKTIPFSKSMFGADRMLYHRVDLLDGLKEAVCSDVFPGEKVEIRLASRATGVDCEAGIVTLADGTTVQGHLVIAADGIHSALRRDVLGQPQDAIPTGLSAYRIIIPTSLITNIPEAVKVMNPSDSWTTMIFGHDRRIIMGPCRDGTVYSIVALVPDEHLHEKSTMDSWTSPGSTEKLLQSFEDFPQWIKEILKATPSLGLWQLRDIDQLTTWYRGRCILIGDAAHAMLPLQGQGASQSVEDAEALQAIFKDFEGGLSGHEVEAKLAEVFRCRYQRASIVQLQSRQQAKPASNIEGTNVTMNPIEFMEYNARYEGARDWQRRQMAGEVE
jgi:salicylate hydroxylase